MIKLAPNLRGSQVVNVGFHILPNTNHTIRRTSLEGAGEIRENIHATRDFAAICTVAQMASPLFAKEIVVVDFDVNSYHRQHYQRMEMLQSPADRPLHKHSPSISSLFFWRFKSISS